MDNSNNNSDKAYSALLDELSTNSLENLLYTKALLAAVCKAHNIETEEQPLIHNSISEELSVEEKIKQAYRLIYDNNIQLNVLATNIAIIYEKVTGLPLSDFLDAYIKQCTTYATNIALGKALR